MEKLYNGIVLPEEWPPKNCPGQNGEGMPLPYLEKPPEVIDITVGRQLFVDSFLIESATMKPHWYQAQKYENNPVLFPETPLERGERNYALPEASAKSGGVWWDKRDKIYKMWYEAGWYQTYAYATSKDGLHWERPALDDGTNRILPNTQPDSNTVFIDESSEEQRYKLYSHGPNGNYAGFVATSKDGIHWENYTITGSGQGDRSTMFYNPFRKKWVFSIRSYYPGVGRCRDYYEFDRFLEDAPKSQDGQVFWMTTDRKDEPDPDYGLEPQLYNVDAVGYESIMLGLFQIFKGPENTDCEKTGIPKVTELQTMFSRDGFHFSRPNRESFITAGRKAGTWDRGYVQSIGGICLIHGDELWFYYTGFAGDESNTFNGCWLANGMYANGSIGLAKLRRDGFVSMDAKEEPAELLTRQLVFCGDKCGLFVNVDSEHGELRCELLDGTGKAIPGFEMENSIALSVNSTCARMQWKNQQDISALQGKTIRIRFAAKNTSLFAFWAGDEKGESGGFKAAGEIK